MDSFEFALDPTTTAVDGIDLLEWNPNVKDGSTPDVFSSDTILPIQFPGLDGATKEAQYFMGEPMPDADGIIAILIGFDAPDPVSPELSGMDVFVL